MDESGAVRSLQERLSSLDPDDLVSAAADHGISEELALALLTRRDLPAAAIEALSRNQSLKKHRKVMVAIVGHMRTPRHISLPAVRHMFTFDLVKLSLLPAVPSDVRVAIDETIVSRLEQISEGERLTLAKQSSGRVATALLLDAQRRVVLTALENPHMTEVGIIKALSSREAPAHLVEALSHHGKWSLRRDIRIALLRNRHTGLAQAIAFAEGLAPELLREVLEKSEMAEEIREYLMGRI